MSASVVFRCSLFPSPRPRSAYLHLSTTQYAEASNTLQPGRMPAFATVRRLDWQEKPTDCRQASLFIWQKTRPGCLLSTRLSASSSRSPLQTLFQCFSLHVSCSHLHLFARPLWVPCLDAHPTRNDREPQRFATVSPEEAVDTWQTGQAAHSFLGGTNPQSGVTSCLDARCRGMTLQIK